VEFINKIKDDFLIRKMTDEAVAWFHEARLHPDNADANLFKVARKCANGAFQMHADKIPAGREEIVARRFMEECRATFAVEVPKVLNVSEPEPELVS
jgi:hypothetical protein